MKGAGTQYNPQIHTVVILFLQLDPVSCFYRLSPTPSNYHLINGLMHLIKWEACPSNHFIKTIDNKAINTRRLFRGTYQIPTLAHTHWALLTHTGDPSILLLVELSLLYLILPVSPVTEFLIWPHCLRSSSSLMVSFRLEGYTVSPLQIWLSFARS